jgi:hypothetical protein
VIILGQKPKQDIGVAEHGKFILKK